MLFDKSKQAIMNLPQENISNGEMGGLTIMNNPVQSKNDKYICQSTFLHGNN